MPLPRPGCIRTLRPLRSMERMRTNRRRLGIRMKLSIDNRCKFNGFMLLSQTRAEYLRCCASFSRRLGRQTFCGGTGTGEKATECQLGLKDRLHPPIGQSLEMSDEFEQTQFTFVLQP